MMKNASAVATDPSLRNNVKLPVMNNPGLSVNTKAGPLPYIFVKSPVAGLSIPSPPTKSHFKCLPDNVVAVEASDPAAIRKFIKSPALIVDIRPYNNYSISRLENAHNICIPTTLLKRPTYDLLHVISTTALPKDIKERITSCQEPTNVLVYDASSTEKSVSFGLYQTIQKFLKHECFTVGFLNGGFQQLHELLRDSSLVLSDTTPVSPNPPLTSLEVSKLDSGSKDSFVSSPGNDSSRETSPFLSGFTLPSATTANQKMLMSIKKTLPKLDTTTTYTYKLRLPEGFEEHMHRLPKWLSFFAEEYGSDRYNEKVLGILSEKFNRLEKSEQVRLSMAISNTSHENKEDKESKDSSIANALSPGVHLRLHSGTGSGYCSPSAPCPYCDKIHYTIPKGVEYGYKNRYNNIWPYEHSRVKLISSPSCTTPKKELSDDYFNANYIKFKKLAQREYIATQSPLESTQEDFWNTVWYNGVKGVVCLNKPSVFAPKTYYEEDQYFDKSRLSVKIKGVEEEKGFAVRKMEMEKHGKRRYVYHFAYTEWPDFGVPDNFDTVSRLLKAKNEKIELLKDQKPPTSEISNTLDLLVHCSAGCGRTGCFITLDMVNECFAHANSETYDPWGSKDLIFKAVQLQRQQRIAMVQTLDQFIYCYESILREIINSMRSSRSSGD